MTLPFGFEEFGHLEHIKTDFSLESLHYNNKELALISAPDEFDVNTLKGETIVLNGSADIQSQGYDGKKESGVKWEIHATSALCDKHLNILMPSVNEQVHKLTPQVAVNVNVVKRIQLPHFTYPKKSKKISKLPKPDNLEVRWKPFGADEPYRNPMTLSVSKQASNIRNIIVEKTAKKKKKKRKSEERLPVDVEKIKKLKLNENVEENINKNKLHDDDVNEVMSVNEELDVCKTKHKHKKKKKNISRVVEVSEEVDVTNKKKRKHKKKNKIVNEGDENKVVKLNEEVNETSKRKKKKKSKMRNEEDK